MPRAKKPWTKTVEVAGVAVRLYERGGTIYREVRLGAGAKDRKSLHTADRAHAVQLAEALAREVAHLKYAGRVGPLTMGQLVALYRTERFPLLSPNRQRTVRGMLALLAQHFPDALAVDDLTQHRVDAYAAARRAGTLVSPRHRTPEPGARAGTIRNEVYLLATMLRWARQHRVQGRPLLTSNPLEGVTLPRETNARRPVSTPARYAATLAHADAVDPRGRFRCLLVLARYTGRRINALVNLRVSDVLRAPAQVEAALGAIGQPVGAAAHWPYGALRFRREFDKREYDAVVPVSADARTALDAYLGAHPRVGDVPLFPATGDDAKAAHKTLAGYWLNRAEARAELPPLDRGGWHALRRLWASERRHLPVQDVMEAGGWRSATVMQTAYQHADAATVYGVVALAPATATPRPPREKRGEAPATRPGAA